VITEKMIQDIDKIKFTLEEKIEAAFAEW
jgi:hypothetical protein